MRRIAVLALATALAAPLAAQIATPDRPITDPRSLASPVNPAARPVPLEDLVYSRNVGSATWSADGKQLFLATNLTGRMNIWRTDVDGGWPVQLTQSDDAQGGLVAAPDGRTLYFTQDRGGNEQYDLYAVPTAGGAVTNLTNTPDMREAGLLIAPDGRSGVLSTKKSGEGQVNLAIIDLATRAVRPLVTEPNPQLRWSAVAWIDEGRALIAQRGNADSTQSEIMRVDVATGAVTPLLSKAGVNFYGEDATADGRQIVASSDEGTGRTRAGIYDTRTKRWRWLKPTPWVQTADGLSPDGRTLLVRTNVDGRSQLSTVNMATLAERPLALDPGVNAGAATQAFSPDSRRLLVSHAGADTPAELYVTDVVGDRTRRVTALAMASLDPANLPKSQVVTYRSFDGTPVSAIVTMPFNLNRDGANPAIVIPHGGPTGQSQDGFSRQATAFASRGYVVIQPNFRGSTGYGRAFQTANFKDLGGGDLKDTIAAKRFLVDSGYVDPARVGITGGSYGGFMTLMALAKTPDAFAAGVQQFGIINWNTMYETADALLRAYVISLIGDPKRDRKVYEATSPITYIRQVKAPLLTLQGANDIRVPEGQAREVEKLLKARGTVAETIVYPAEGHGFAKRENQIDALRRTVDWFDKYLKPAR